MAGVPGIHSHSKSMNYKFSLPRAEAQHGKGASFLASAVLQVAVMLRQQPLITMISNLSVGHCVPAFAMYTHHLDWCLLTCMDV